MNIFANIYKYGIADTLGYRPALRTISANAETTQRLVLELKNQARADGGDVFISPDWKVTPLIAQRVKR